MNNAELFKLACQCLILDMHPELVNGVKEKFSSGEVDIYRFVKLCSDHLILPTIYRQIDMRGITELFPTDLNEHLNDIYKLNIQRNKEILNQIEELCIILNQEDIKPVFLKGTANILDKLYYHFGDRMIGDIDFLVEEKDYKKTVEVLIKLGYKSNFKPYFETKDQKHYPRLYKKDVPADIEVHRIPVDKDFAKKFDTNTIFSDKVKINNKLNCYVSSDTNKLILTFIHSQLINKGFNFKLFSIRDIYDFYLLSKRVEWQEVLFNVEEKTIIQSFFNCTLILFSTPSESIVINDKKGRKLFNQIYWFLNHPRIHWLYIFLKKLYYLVFIKFLMLFLSKSMFNSLLNRITDKDWWRFHLLNGLKKHFN